MCNRLRVLTSLGVVGFLISCSACMKNSQTKSPNAGDESSAMNQNEGQDSPLEPKKATRKNLGEQLDVAVPLVNGDVLQLASLRGKVVVMELSASGEEGWDESQKVFSQLRDEHRDQVEFVVVSADSETDVTDPMKDHLQVGWDPQGALAAQLGVASFPTLLVLDREGRIVVEMKGWNDEVESKVRLGIKEAL